MDDIPLHGKRNDRPVKELPKGGYALQQWPGYAPEFMNLVPVQDNGRKIAIDRIHFTEDGKLVLDGPTVTPQPYPSGNEPK